MLTSFFDCCLIFFAVFVPLGDLHWWLPLLRVCVYKVWAPQKNQNRLPSKFGFGGKGWWLGVTIFFFRLKQTVVLFGIIQYYTVGRSADATAVRYLLGRTFI